MRVFAFAGNIRAGSGRVWLVVHIQSSRPEDIKVLVAERFIG